MDLSVWSLGKSGGCKKRLNDWRKQLAHVSPPHRGPWLTVYTRVNATMRALLLEIGVGFRDADVKCDFRGHGRSRGKFNKPAPGPVPVERGRQVRPTAHWHYPGLPEVTASATERAPPLTRKDSLARKEPRENARTGFPATARYPLVAFPPRTVLLFPGLPHPRDQHIHQLGIVGARLP